MVSNLRGMCRKIYTWYAVLGFIVGSSYCGPPVL